MPEHSLNSAALQTTKPSLTVAEWGAVGFTAAYMGVSLVACVLLGNREFIFYFVVMCILIAAVAVLRRRANLETAALWGLSFWGLAHMAGGLMPLPEAWPIHGETHVLYNGWIVPGLLKYDQLVHAYGFGLVTWICWQALASAFVARGAAARPTFGLLVLCVAGGMGFGAANEVVEFFATITLPGTNVGGYQNTGWDLVANLVGCVMAAIAIFVGGKNGNVRRARMDAT